MTAQEKLKILQKVLKEGSSVSSVCHKNKISRKTFYSWKKKYLSAGPRDKSTCLEKRHLKGLQHPRGLRLRFKKDILRLVTLHPELGSHSLSKILKEKGKFLSNHAVYTLLKELGLETREKRREFAGYYRSPLRLMPEVRKRMVEEVLLAGEGAKEVSREFLVSRKTLWKWTRRYKKAQEVQIELVLALKDQNPTGSSHPRGTPEWLEKKILEAVIRNPEYSTHKLAEIIPQIGNHGIQNVLLRNSLNTFDRRLEYARIHVPVSLVQPVTGWFDRLKTVWQTFVPTIAPAPPPLLRRLADQGKPLLVSFLSSSVLTLIFLFWLSILSGQPFSTKLGLFFASISLSCGTFFFLYSMKYYFTLAIVLSFSSQTGPFDSAQGKESGEQGMKGWLARIFGLNGSLRGLTSREVRPHQVPAGGLQPSLEHIKLKRYPFISVHLPFYNEKKVANRILSACTSFDYPAFEVIVVDDSTDETTTIVQRFADQWNKQINTNNTNKPMVRVIHRPTREGFKGGALREALRASDPKAEFVVVFDADFIPYPDTLELFMKYFQSVAGTLDFADENRIAAVAGYQWHVLNKSENWITRGVRTEYAGSYVIERPGQEILGGMKLIHGSVYMIRADILKKFGWGTSITEDFELTLRLYEQGYKVVYTPYIQGPAECVSTIKRLIRQRMRWAEGHSHNIRKMFLRLLFGSFKRSDLLGGQTSPGKIWVPSPLTLTEKLEFLYLSPYYLQAFFFMIGTLSWLISETVFRARLPFWTSLWGWSLVLTNLLSLPLVNAVGLFLEESEEKDYVGLVSFVVLSYILVPFQAYASVKGFLEKEEGPWFRTPKTGLITDIFTRGRFYRWISGIIPGRAGAPALVHANDIRMEILRMNPNPSASSGQVIRTKNSDNLNSDKFVYQNPYLALATANNRFENFRISPRKIKWIGRTFLVSLLIFSTLLLSLAPTAPYFIKPKETQAKGFGMLAGPSSAGLPQASLAKASREESRFTLEILNPYSHPKEGEDWVVNFKTTGQADLTITPQDRATVEDLDFVSLKCGNEERNPHILESFPHPETLSGKDTVFYPQWECPVTGSLTHRVNKSGKHTLKFQFGDQIAYAYNAVAVDTSTSSSATAYSFQRKTWYDGTRLWSAFYSGTEIEFWYSADWGATWTQNTLATIAVSTNDFTIEADSSNAFIAYTGTYDDIEAKKADTTSWWNSSWAKREQLTVSAAPGNGVSAGYTVKYNPTGSDAADIYNDSLASGNDFRIVYWNGSTWTELDRDLVTFTSSNIEVWFKLQAAISGGNSDNNYYAYYDNSGAGSPPADKTNVYLHYKDCSATNQFTWEYWRNTTGANVQEDAGRIKVWLTTGPTNYVGRLSDTYVDGVEVWMDFEKSGTDTNYNQIGVGLGYSFDNMVQMTYEYNQNWGYKGFVLAGRNAGADTTYIHTGSQTVSSGKLKMNWIGSTVKGWYDSGSGWVYLGNISVSNSNAKYPHIHVYDYWTNWVDNFTVRKVVATEPTVSVGGEQGSVYPGTGFSWSLATAIYDATPWFNSSWNYRKKIPLTGAGSAGTNYQVKIVVGYSTGGNVTCNSNCQTDFDDIRFTDNDGTTELDHWRESYTASSTATFWVEVKDSLSSSSNPDIYLYYGNGTAGSGSNGSNTFEMFDDFNDGNYNGWTVASGIWSASSGVLETSSTSHPYISYNSFSSTEYIVETLMRITSTISGDQQAWVLGRFSDSNNFYGYGYRGADATTRWETWKRVGGTFSELGEHNPQTMTQNTWYKQAMFFNGPTIKSKSWQSGGTDPGWQLTVTDSSLSSGKVGFQGTWAAATVQFDDVFVRKYSSSEPTIGTPGSEEEQAADEYDYPAVTRDSNSKVWITATHLSGTDYLFKARQGTTANDISAWGTASSLDTSTNSNKYGVIVSLGSGNLYSVWIDGTAIEGKKYNGTSWDASPTSIATGVTGLTNNMSAVSDSSGNVHLLYIDSNDYAVYQEYTTSWQTAVTLDGTAGNDYPTISLNTSNSDLYALWIRSNVIYYKKGVSPYASANWDASATSWKSTGTNAYVTSNYSGAGMIFAQWTEGTASPYSINWDYIIIPEKLWLLLGLGLIIPKLLRRRRRINSASPE